MVAQTVYVHQARADGRVALGHVGGRSPHKGASLLEAVLRQGDFSNLHLTMIDGHLANGQRIETLWGTTPVTLTGPYAQSEVPQLYSQLDVVLAPSTWPESFGLVTREALNAGLWTVASNLGAVGSGILDDLNGFIIDTSSVSDLQSVLAKIDAAPERFRGPTTIVDAKPRSMGEQAEDLYRLYRQIAAKVS